MGETRLDHLGRPRPEQMAHWVGAMIGVVLGGVAGAVAFTAAGLTLPEGAVLGYLAGGIYLMLR